MKKSKRDRIDAEFAKILANWKHPTEEDIERLDRLRAPISEELESHGLSVNDMHSINVRISREIIEVLIKHLMRLNRANIPGQPREHTWESKRVQDGIIRSLCMASEPFDGTHLKECFENTNDDGLQFAILNTIDGIRPYGIDDWIDEIYDKPEGSPLKILKYKRR